MGAAFEVMISAVNSQLETLRNGGFKIYDKDNPSYYIDKISYHNGADKLLVNFKEDENVK